MADLWLQFVLTIDATLRVATPLILCAMAGLFSERSGIIDISLEGKMLMSAFAAASMAALTGSSLLGLAGGILVSVALSLICLLYTSPSPRDRQKSRMPSSA